MAKGKKTVFFCQECGYESPKWMGQCPACRQWNTFVEETVSSGAGKAVGTGISQIKHMEPMALSQVKITEEERIHTGIGELDRVLGGGIVSGSGNRKIHLASPGVQKSDRKRAGVIYFRRRISKTDKTSGAKNRGFQ